MNRFLIGAGTAAMLVTGAAVPAGAQQGAPLEGRVGRLESEMRAVQRKVFPNGAAQMVEPQIAPSTPAPSPVGVPASSAVADLSSRVTSLEQQMASMTGQIELTQHKLRMLEEQFTAYRTATDAKLAAGAAPASPVPAADVAATGDVRVPTAPRPAPTPTPAAAVAGVEKPDTGDAAEDAYLYGYRLWAAKKYPEAQAQLKKMVADFPKSRRASFAQNLLGRAYLDDGKPSLASIAFYDNYKKYPDGERAPDSLFYLGSALMKLNKPADACKVYGELTDVYGDKISAGMKADVAKARTTAKCK
ncbi:outer membrane protein assembly factor BamD [uncultured Sphingomonas sp.]|uniref:tetratricopeptide repeat protein n=1 Tax=uncultured Sphingomonas sp. TaxID=158754 RepID=UPI0030DCE598